MKCKLLPKTLWATFATFKQADAYGRQLEGLLAQGRPYMVQLKIEVESTPTPDPLCRYFLTTDGVWASGSEHAI